MLTPIQIARVCHEVNRAYCRAIGDDSQPPWEQASDWQRSSCEIGVKEHLDVGLTPEQSHEIWMEDKRRAGWVYGPVKDPDRKEHPCIVPYAQLPQEQQVKDHLFAAVVRALAVVGEEGNT